MGINLGGARRAAAIVTAALVASAFTASTAAAVPGTIIGPSDLSSVDPEDGTFPSRVVLNTADSDLLLEAPEKGTIVQWAANFDCADGCGEARLVVLRETSTPETYSVVRGSEWRGAVESGVEYFSASLLVAAHDRLGLEFRDGGKLFVSTSRPDAERRSSLDEITGTAVALGSLKTGNLALYNAAWVPLSPTLTTVSANPNPALAGSTVEFTVNVAQMSLCSLVVAACGEAGTPTGTVSLSSGAVPIAGCQNLTLTEGTATCESPAPSGATYRQVDAEYSGDDTYKGSTGWTSQYTFAPSIVKAVVKPNPVTRLAKVAYSAEISGFLLASTGVGAQGGSLGQAAFFVDGQPVADCQALPVDYTGLVSCPSFAPAIGGTHKLKVTFKGGQYVGDGSGETSFEVLAPAVSVPAIVDFSSITVGAAATRTVTLTNSGKANLKVAHSVLKGDGPFAIATDGCVHRTLAPAATCEVEVAFKPVTPGTHTSTLAFSHDAPAGATVALTGAAVAAPAPPVPPAPTPTPTPTPTPEPSKGGTLDPEKKPTLTVTIPSSSSSSGGSTPAPVLSLPLSCPATHECLLDGKLTISTSTLSRSARAAAADSKTVARFSKVQVEAGGLKTIKLKLDAAFVKSAQKRGVRRIRATLTINTVLGSGERTTNEQRVTIVLPKAAKEKAAKRQQVRPRFTG